MEYFGGVSGSRNRGTVREFCVPPSSRSASFSVYREAGGLVAPLFLPSASCLGAAGVGVPEPERVPASAPSPPAL